MTNKGEKRLICAFYTLQTSSHLGPTTIATDIYTLLFLYQKTESQNG